MEISAQTEDAQERDARTASIVQLLATDKGQGVVEQLRARRLTIEDVHRAVLAADISTLEPKKVSAPKRGCGPVMLGETIDAWLKWLEGQHKSVETIATYKSILRGIEEAFGIARDAGGKITEDVAVGSITRSQGEAWLSGPKATNGGKPWAATTQRTAHAVVSQLWDRAMAEDEERSDRSGGTITIARNFWRRHGSRKGVKGPKIKKTRFEFLRRGEAGRVLWKNRGNEYAAWIAVGIYAGLRGGETANLRVGLDVDLAAGLIRIQPRKGKFAWSPKTDNSLRNIPIHPHLARWIRRHIRLGYAGDIYLFRMPGRDAPISRRQWQDWVREALEAAGIRYGRTKDALTAHSLRHTFASWLTMADVHPLKIAKLMGDTVAEVMKTYAHLVAEDLEDAIRRL